MTTCIVVLASTSYSGHQLYDQRIAKALSAFGRVLYVNPTLAVGRTAPPAGEVCDSPDVSVLTPRMLPFGRRRMLYAVTAVLTGVQIRLRLRSFRRDSDTLYYVVIAAPAATLRALPHGSNVHIIKDDYIAGSHLIGIAPHLLRRRFFARIRLADHVTAVSPFLQQVLLTRGVRSTVVPAGCTVDLHRHPLPAELRDTGAPRAVFIGMISDRIDFDLIARLVDDGTTVVFVGPTQNTFTKGDAFSALRARDGFIYLAPRTGPALEAVLQSCQIGLIPYVASDFNNASFPLKAFEYLAAGLPIVSTPLPAMSWLDHDVIHICSTSDEFAEAVQNAGVGDADVAARCRSIAVDNSWDSRAKTYAALLGLAS